MLTEADLERCAAYLIGLHGPKAAAMRALLRAPRTRTPTRAGPFLYL